MLFQNTNTRKLFNDSVRCSSSAVAVNLSAAREKISTDPALASILFLKRSKTLTTRLGITAPMQADTVEVQSKFASGMLIKLRQ